LRIDANQQTAAFRWRAGCGCRTGRAFSSP
jgi:hypothetical protein